MYHSIEQYRQIFFMFGIFILLALVGYILADSSWDIVMDTLLATETPSVNSVATWTPEP